MQTYVDELNRWLLKNGIGNGIFLSHSEKFVLCLMIRIDNSGTAIGHYVKDNEDFEDDVWRILGKYVDLDWHMERFSKIKAK